MRVTPKSRHAWRGWLDKNHASKNEVWLVFYKRHTGKPTVSYNDAVEEALCFGWIDGVKHSIDDARYMHRFSPRTSTSHWSALNRQRATRMIEAGLMTAAGEEAIRQARQAGRWEHKEQVIDLSMPAELAQGLKRSRKAAAFFDGLAPSYQRQFIAWINAAKRPDTQKRRLKESLAQLERGKKLGMR